MEVDAQSGEWTLVEAYTGERWIIRKKGEPIDEPCYVGQIQKLVDTFPLRQLLDENSYIPTRVSNILNHENLVGPVARFRQVLEPDPELKEGALPQIIVMPMCEAGSLQMLLDEPPLQATETGFLPESLCWHVLLSVLRALAWLHEGTRLDQRLHEGQNRVEWISGEYDRDWMPILHRAVKAENIFFEHPRGKETYGLCRLGNFSYAHVSGHVGSEVDYLATGQKAPKTNSEHGPKDFRRWDIRVVTDSNLFAETPLGQMREKWEAASEAQPLRMEDRPYTKGSELYALGSVLYQMMTRRKLAGPEACQFCECRHQSRETHCTHTCYEDIDLNRQFERTLTDYSQHLRDVVWNMLKFRRLDKLSTLTMLSHALAEWRAWKETEAAADVVDLVDLRLEQHRARMEKRAREKRKTESGNGSGDELGAAGDGADSDEEMAFA